MAKKKREPNESIDDTNFRFHAKRMIDKYHEKGMIIDAMLLARVVGLYELKLRKLSVFIAGVSILNDQAKKLLEEEGLVEDSKEVPA